MQTPLRRVLLEKCTFYYPFGNTGVRNVLEDCQLVGDNIKVRKYFLVRLFLVVFFLNYFIFFLFTL